MHMSGVRGQNIQASSGIVERQQELIRATGCNQQMGNSCRTTLGPNSRKQRLQDQKWLPYLIDSKCNVLMVEPELVINHTRSHGSILPCINGSAAAAAVMEN